MVKIIKIARLTVPVLKDYCAQNHLSLSGKKADLVFRVSEHINAQASKNTM